jgi:hypothetical protein
MRREGSNPFLSATPFISCIYRTRYQLLGEFFRASKRGLHLRFFSRARWSEHWIAIILIIAELFATLRINHESMGCCG